MDVRGQRYLAFINTGDRTQLILINMSSDDAPVGEDILKTWRLLR